MMFFALRFLPFNLRFCLLPAAWALIARTVGNYCPHCGH